MWEMVIGEGPDLELLLVNEIQKTEAEMVNDIVRLLVADPVRPYL